MGPRELFSAGFLRSEKEKIKILSEGDIIKPLTVSAHSFSRKAVEKIEKAGGKAVIV